MRKYKSWLLAIALSVAASLGIYFYPSQVLVMSNPEPDEQVWSLDGEVELLFGRPIVLEGSTVSVKDPDGKEVVDRLETLEGLIEGDKRFLLTVHLKSPNAPLGLTFGTYTVVYRVKGDVGEAVGSFKFTTREHVH